MENPKIKVQCPNEMVAGPGKPCKSSDFAEIPAISAVTRTPRLFFGRFSVFAMRLVRCPMKQGTPTLIFDMESSKINACGPHAGPAGQRSGWCCVCMDSGLGATRARGNRIFLRKTETIEKTPTLRRIHTPPPPGKTPIYREVPSENCACCAAKQPFFGPKCPRNRLKMAKRRQTVATMHVRPGCPVTESPFVPSSSTTCPRNGPKMAKNALNVHCLCQTGPKPRMGRILDYAAQNQIPRAPGLPTTPHSLWFPSLNIAQRDA